jgi:Domain of unknown function (DUF4902)
MEGRVGSCSVPKGIALTASGTRAPVGYVQMRRAELPQLHIKHLTSAVDQSIALPEGLASAVVVSGYTEWVGIWHCERVSIGWDWAFADDSILFLNPIEIRTNLLLIAPDGVAQSPILTRVHLHEWLESLPWRDGAAIRELVRG